MNTARKSNNDISPNQEFLIHLFEERVNIFFQELSRDYNKGDVDRSFSDFFHLLLWPYLPSPRSEAIVYHTPGRVFLILRNRDVFPFENSDTLSGLNFIFPACLARLPSISIRYGWQTIVYTDDGTNMQYLRFSKSLQK